MNGEFKRGEVYWVRDALTNGSEEAFRRPFVVVSSDEQNTKWGTIIGASMTSKPRYGEWYVRVTSTQRKSWVLCNSIIEIDKARLMEYYGTLSPEEMKAVNKALKVSLDLVDEPELEPEVEGSEGEEKEDVLFQTEMYKKLYEKALDELVKLKLQLELSEKCDKSREKPQKKVEAPPAGKVNINTASAVGIAAVLGIGTGYSYLITGYRRKNGPFVDIEELRDVEGLPKDFVERYGNLITIDENDQIKKNDDEIKPKAKVNVNTATPEEICEKTGLNLKTCNRIRAYRNKHGAFKDLKELLNVDRFGKGCMEKYGHLLEV